MINDLLERYRRDGDARSRQRLMDEQRALVCSVCRRYLRDPADVEDAVQETFLKLFRQANGIEGSLVAWLSATASSTSVDIIRRASRERRRRELIAPTVPTLSEISPLLIGEAIEQRIQEALLSLDEPARQLIIARFYRKEPVRVLAGRHGLTVSGMSRRISAAVRDLSVILRDMGLKTMDDLSVIELLAGKRRSAIAAELPDEGLRFAPDWQKIAASYSQGADTVRPPPGWTRPIRVGVLVSWLSATTIGFNGVPHLLEDPVWSTSLLQERGFQLVAIAEPQSTTRGPIERILREYDLTAGLVDTTDADSLATVDVILLGLNYAITTGEARALFQAVRGGVGLLNEYWLDVRHIDSAEVCALCLAVPPIFAFHLPPVCSQRLSATVVEEHPLLPGLKQNDQLNVSACGPLYRVVDSASVHIIKDQVVEPHEHRIAHLGPAHMPVFILGQCGRGRVAVSNIYRHEQIARHLNISESEYVTGLLRWLAEPRRELL